MWKIKKFLFCLELETGAMFIGFSSIMLSLIFGILFLLISAYDFERVLDFIRENVRRPNEKMPVLRKSIE